MQRVVSMQPPVGYSIHQVWCLCQQVLFTTGGKMVPCRMPRLWRWPVGRSCDEAHGCGVPGVCAPAVQRRAVAPVFQGRLGLKRKGRGGGKHKKAPARLLAGGKGGATTPPGRPETDYAPARKRRKEGARQTAAHPLLTLLKMPSPAPNRPASWPKSQTPWMGRCPGRRASPARRGCSPRPAGGPS